MITISLNGLAAGLVYHGTMSVASNILCYALGTMTGVIGIALAMAAPNSAPIQGAAMVSQPVIDGVDKVLHRQADGHFYVDAMVNGQLVHFVVDTGATDVALSTKDAKHIGIPFSPDEFEVVGMGASGPVRGKRVVLDSVAIGKKEAFDVSGSILEGSDISLLGQAYLSRIGLVKITGDEMLLR